MMLDLNLSVEVFGEEKRLEISATHVQRSGSYYSSVVNAGNEDDTFTILKATQGDGAVGASEYHEKDGTIPLFPVASGGDGGKSTSSRRQWLELGCNGVEHDAALEQKVSAHQQQLQLRQQLKKSRRGPRPRSSQYRGVTFYRRTGRWESHIWDCGKQVYLGGFDTAHAAARAYDRAAIKFRGVDADVNFDIGDYDEDIKQMSNFTKEEFVHILRRKTAAFSGGSSKYRGIMLHRSGQWEARMGQFLGNKAYDKAAIKWNGREAVTNSELSTYEVELVSEPKNGEGNQVLDLNLGIAPPYTFEARRENISSNHFPLHQSWNDLPTDRGTRIENSTSTTVRVQQPSYRYHQAIAFEHPSAWGGPSPSFFPLFKERAIEKRMDSWKHVD